jgi:hypothetical protein
MSCGCGCSAGCGVVEGCAATGDAVTAESVSTAVDGVDVELFVSTLTTVAVDEMLPTSTDSAGFSGLLLMVLLKKKKKDEIMPFLFPCFRI